MSGDPVSAMLWLFQSIGIGAEGQRTEPTMINLAELDIRRMNREAQIARNNRYGWMDDLAIRPQEDGTGQSDDVMRRVRRRIGHAVVYCGNWLAGTRAADSTHPATIGSSAESMR